MIYGDTNRRWAPRRGAASSGIGCASAENTASVIRRRKRPPLRRRGGSGGAARRTARVAERRTLLRPMGRHDASVLALVRHAGLRIAAAGTILLLLASCSGGPTEESAKDLAKRCGSEDPGVPVQALPYDPGSGEGVDGYALGEGEKGVIFSNQTDTDLCDWLPIAKKMAGPDRRALIYDYSYKPDAAKEVEAAAEGFAGLGVKEVVLVGASKGAVGSLAAAPSIDELEVAGVASLSAVGEFEGLDSLVAAGKVRAPLLVLAARGDPTTDAGVVAPKLVETSPSKDKQVVLFDGPDHGIDLLKGKHAPRARSLLEGFVDQNLP